MTNEIKIKGRNKFTSTEIANLEELIKQKDEIPSKQKVIRDEIREMGFYWTDFHPSQETPKVKYNVENFKELISTKRIEIIRDKKIFQNNSNQSVKNKFSKEGLSPWVGNNPKVLILGTMPSDISLAGQAYYCNPANLFWKIIETIFPKQKNEKELSNKDYIISKNIALWDCIKCADRIGSMDNKFNEKSLIPNDLHSFMKKYPSIKTIILNGKTKTVKYYNRFFSDIKQCKVICLNSTSSLNRKWISDEDKIKEWTIIKTLINNE